MLNREPAGQRVAVLLGAPGRIRTCATRFRKPAYLTYLATNGIPAPIVSAWAGHSDLSMAQRVYVHPSAKDLEQGRDALSVLLS